ncbi:phage tail spike protein, partial [Bacillus thuringiensis]|uniref:phage tail spike protein n=2 Tax=Bacillus thuringiensis TaxID=1428 RepID=UPI0034584C9B
MSNNDLHIFDFKTEQIIAVIKEQDYWDDLRKWELKNNVDMFEFTVSDGTHKAARLMQQNIVLKRVRDGSFVSYVINESEQDSVDRSKKIYALSEHTKLRKAKVIKPQTIESYTVNQWMDFALESTKWQRGVTEYASFRTIHIKEFTNPLDLLKTIASTFDLEIRFRTEVQGSFIVGRYVDMVRKVGRDNGKEIVLGKDLQGIRRIENSQDAISALVGVGPFNEETGEYLTFEKINGGKLYVADADALQRWTEDGSHKYGIYSPQTEDQNMSAERLKQLTEAELKKRINSTVKYEVNPVALEKLFGLSHEKVNRGDIVHIKDTKFTPPLFLEARLIAADECDTNAANDKYYFGDFKEVEDTRSLLDRMYAQVMGSLAGKANKGLLDKLEELVKETNEQVEIVKTESQTAKDIATKTKEYMEQNLVDIIENANPPTTNLKPNKTLWRDISGGKPGMLKIWTGTTWELVVADTGPLQQSIKDVKEDIETTKTELNKKVQEAQNQATGQFNEVKETLQSVSRTISDVQNEQGNINKKVTQIEQNADGFKTSIESLTKKDNDISNKLNTVEQTVEGTKKTISDVQQTTSELKKTTTEIKEEAGRTKERMEQINSKVENIDIGVNNLVINSSCDNEKPRMFDQPGESQVGGVDDIRYYEKHLAIKCNRYTDAFYQIGGYEKSLHGLEPGKEVTISADINCESVDYHFEMFYATNAEGNNWRAFVGELYKELKIWKRRSFTFKIPNDTTSIMFRIYFGRVVTSNGTWLNFKNVQIERGNIATGYKRAYQDQVTTDEFTKKTTEIEKSVDGVKTTVSTVQKDQGTMQTTLNQVKQTTDSNSQTITTLSQTQGKQGEIIQQNTSDITQLNNQIKSKVTDTQMQEYIGGLGSTNLLFNAAFEDRVINATTGVVTSRKPSISKWSVGPNGSNFTAVPETARNHDGMNSVKLESSGQTVDRNAAFYQSLPVSPNTGDYVLSAWFYTDAVATIDNTAFVMIEFYNGSTWVTNKVIQLVPLLTNGSWKFISVTMPAPVSGVTTIRFVVVIRKNGRLWVSQPQLQQGITPSSFMENPKDYANYDQLVGEIAKKVATSDFDNKVTQMETTINQQSNRIDLKAEKTDVYTKTEANGQFGSKAMVEKHESSITLMSNEINSTVKKGDIISSINQTAEQITIDVSRLNINADTVVKWLTAKGINADVIKISGDKVTIDKNGITAKMADFLYEDDNGQKFSVIPRKNLIVDHCFAHITKGYQNAQFFNIQYSPFWEIHGSPAVENSIVETGMEGMINAMRINGEDWIRYKHFRDVQPGKKYTISAHFRAAMLSGKKVTAEPTIRVKFGTWQGDKPVDKQIFEKKFSAPKIADGKIVRYTVTFTVPQDYNMSNGYIFFDIFAYGQVAYEQSCMVSGIQLVEGELPCIYSWDLSYAQAVSGETPFSGFTLGTVDNAFLFENNRNKIPFITAAGDGHALEVKGVSHAFVSFTDQNGRFGYIGHGSPGAGTFHIDTRNPVWVSNRLTARGINIGSGTFGSAGSM